MSFKIILTGKRIAFSFIIAVYILIFITATMFSLMKYFKKKVFFGTLVSRGASNESGII